MICSMTIISNSFPPSRSLLVRSISAWLGRRFPDGWLCTKIMELAAPLRAAVKITFGSALQRHWNYDTIEYVEEFKIMLLNRVNRVLGIVDISVGGMAGTIARIHNESLIILQIIKPAFDIGNILFKMPGSNSWNRIEIERADLSGQLFDWILLWTEVRPGCQFFSVESCFVPGAV